MTAFDSLIQGVTATNSFQCVTYNAKRVNHVPVERSREAYAAWIVYQDTDANVIDLVTIRVPTIAAFTAVANHILADATLETAMGGSASRDSDTDKYSATLKCHDQNGEIYFRGLLTQPNPALIFFRRCDPEQG